MNVESNYVIGSVIGVKITEPIAPRARDFSSSLSKFRELLGILIGSSRCFLLL